MIPFRTVLNATVDADFPSIHDTGDLQSHEEIIFVGWGGIVTIDTDGAVVLTAWNDNLTKINEDLIFYADVCALNKDEVLRGVWSKLPYNIGRTYPDDFRYSRSKVSWNGVEVVWRILNKLAERWL